MFKARFGADFIVNWHHQAICEHLEAVERGEIRNLIINLPPGGTKTELVSINWPARAIARNPLSRFLSLSYADELVALNSQTCRNIIQSDEFQELWPLRVADDSKAKKRWNVVGAEGKVLGGMYANTSHGQVTGFRAGYMSEGFNGAIILDDPMKASDAESEVMRREVNSNIARTIRSRRAKPDVPIVVVQQRLHEEDATGWLMAGHLGEDFEQLKIPALDGSGKSYWEMKEPTEDLLRFKAAQPYIFSSQYQQEPAPEEGTYFKKDWFKYYDELPNVKMFTYGASDYAMSEGQGDWTCHGVIGLDANDDIYLLDFWRGQEHPEIWVERMLDLMELHKTTCWAEESDQIAKGFGPLIKKRMMERRVYGARHQFSSASKKDVKARTIQSRMATKGIYVPRGKAWVTDLINECLTFPNGKHDDQVDVLSLFGRMLAGLRAGELPQDEKKGITTRMPTFEELRKRSNRVDN